MHGGHSNLLESRKSKSVVCFMGSSLRDGFSHYAKEPHGFSIWKVPFGLIQKNRARISIISLPSGVQVVSGSLPAASLIRDRAEEIT